jgi:AcrR family transcriptional regulator
MAARAGRGVIWLRPEHASGGRPAQRSRAEITAVAVAVADSEGLDAVSMRRVAAGLGTGAASLYRYVDTRDDVLDLMTDSVGAEYELLPPTGRWLADLLGVAEQARAIMRRHPWLPSLVITRPVLGPNGLRLIEHLLDVLAGHPASVASKLESFAMLNGVTALFVQNELGAGPGAHDRAAAYLEHALTSGSHPRLAELLGAGQPPGEVPAPADRFGDILAGVLSGLLGP